MIALKRLKLRFWDLDTIESFLHPALAEEASRDPNQPTDYHLAASFRTSQLQICTTS
jgi:hypothetical protein